MRKTPEIYLRLLPEEGDQSRFAYAVTLQTDRIIIGAHGERVIFTIADWDHVVRAVDEARRQIASETPKQT